MISMADCVPVVASGLGAMMGIGSSLSSSSSIRVGSNKGSDVSYFPSIKKLLSV